MKVKNGCVIIPGGVQPWPHEERVAKILAAKGYKVEFLAKSTIKTADILLDGVEFEIKSPKTDKANSLEHVLRRALRQSSNIIIDSARINEKRITDNQVQNFLISKARRHKQIKRLLFITKKGKIVDVKALI